MKIQNGYNEVYNRSLNEMFYIDMKNVYAVIQDRERENHDCEIARHSVCLPGNDDDAIELRVLQTIQFQFLYQK